jgi:hypothetical protein
LANEDMKTSIAILGLTVLTVAAQGVKPQLGTVVIAEKSTVRLGDPIRISVLITNEGQQEIKVGRSETAFDRFEVTDPDGHAVPYVGFDGQVFFDPVRVPPSSAVTIADGLDLTDRYLLQKAGRYSIRFVGQGTGLPESRAIALDVREGRLSESDQVVVSLLPVRPTGWRICKDARGEVTPFGRSRAAGFALHVCLSHMQGKAVYLWLTKAEAKIDPDQEPRMKSEYLGRARGRYVYITVDNNVPALWPKAIEDISHALQIGKE